LKLSDKLTREERYAPARVLENWKEMMEALPYMNEDELLACLKRELKGERRKDFIVRLHRRYTKLRSERELEEYLQ
jgi:hypothetical protein